MNTYVEECMITLSEECAEVIQVVSKIQRFGLTSFHPNDPTVNNLQRLEQEIGDVLCMIDILREEGALDDRALQNAKLAKRIKFKKFSIFSPKPIVIKED